MPAPWDRIDAIPTALGAPPPDVGVSGLFPAQLQFLSALVEAGTTGEDGRRGVLGVMGCGSGKTLALQLAPRVWECRRPLLIAPANLLPQAEREARAFSVDPLPALSYGKLSHPSGLRLLTAAEPDLLLLDEAHILGKGARMRRLWAYIVRNPQVAVIAVTGSPIDRSLRDLAAMAELSLRDWSPLPIEPSALDQWCSVHDPGGEPSALDWSAVGPYRSMDSIVGRLRTIPGVVMAPGRVAAGVSLRLWLDPGLPTPSLDSWELPDGTELVDAIEVARHRSTLRLGFWQDLEGGEEWRDARSAWAREGRRMVEHGGADTMHFAAERAKAGKAPHSAVMAWHRWAHVRKSCAPPVRETHWIDRSFLAGVLAAAKESPHPTVVFAHSKEVFDEAERTGYPVHRAGGDTPPDQQLIVASNAYRRGWNGHHYSNVVVLQPPRSPRRMEQLLSRQHRERQTRDVNATLIMTAQERFILTRTNKMLHGTTPTRWAVADWMN